MALQLLVTAGVLVALGVNLRAARRAPRPGRGGGEPPAWARPAAGLASGALNTSTSTGGPPVVLLLMGRGCRPAVVRDTLTTSFVGFAVVSDGGARADRAPAAPCRTPRWVAALVPLTAAGQLAGRPHVQPARRAGAPTSAC